MTSVYFTILLHEILQSSEAPVVMQLIRVNVPNVLCIHVM